MLGIKRVVVAAHERGLAFRNRILERVLMPGLYYFGDPLGRIQVSLFDLTDPVFAHAQARVLLKSQPTRLESHLELVALGEQEVGLVYYDQKFVEVLAPGTQRIYWKGPIEVQVNRVDIREEFVLPAELAAVLTRPSGAAVPSGLSSRVYSAEVGDHFVGLLIVDGELKKVLDPGYHAFWKFNRSIVVEQLDTRVQAMEVSGQEILTKDKVSLRINLVGQFRISDAVKARTELRNPMEWLYGALQFGLRQTIGTRTLDSLLGAKDELDRAVYEAVVAKAEGYGLVVETVGIKDVILPGEMKDILNGVVAAEKIAQANVIKRREETAATRSLLNTAKLMDEHPTLRRLKELEVLEKVTDKIDRLTVFGGLEGVLKDTVRINV